MTAATASSAPAKIRWRRIDGAWQAQHRGYTADIETSGPGLHLITITRGKRTMFAVERSNSHGVKASKNYAIGALKAFGVARARAA